MRRAARVLAGAVVSAGLLTAAAPADATLRIGPGPVQVSASGRVAVELRNTGRRTTAGTLTLRSGRRAVGSARFRIPARGMRTVRATLSGGVRERLARDRRLTVTAVAQARGVKAVRRALVLVAPARATPPGTTPSSGPSAPAFQEGRYRGGYDATNAELAFNVAGSRLYTGPFDSFYADARCRNADPAYTGPDQEYGNPRSIGPVEATIAADGTFRGEGTYHPGGGSPPIGWTISGRIAGGEAGGEFGASFTDPFGNPCQATMRFTGRFLGSYVIGA